jgi:hypothetical protein
MGTGRSAFVDCADVAAVAAAVLTQDGHDARTSPRGGHLVVRWLSTTRMRRRSAWSGRQRTRPSRCIRFRVLAMVACSMWTRSTRSRWGQVVLLIEREQLRELAGDDSQRCDPCAQRVGEQVGEVVDLVAQRAVPWEGGGRLGGHRGMPRWRASRRSLGHCHIRTPEETRTGRAIQRIAAWSWLASAARAGQGAARQHRLPAGPARHRVTPPLGADAGRPRPDPHHFGMLMTLDHLGVAHQRRLSELVGIDPRKAVPVLDLASDARGAATRLTPAGAPGPVS